MKSRAQNSKKISTRQISGGKWPQNSEKSSRVGWHCTYGGGSPRGYRAKHIRERAWSPSVPFSLVLEPRARTKALALMGPLCAHSPPLKSMLLHQPRCSFTVTLKSGCLGLAATQVIGYEHPPSGRCTALEHLLEELGLSGFLVENAHGVRDAGAHAHRPEAGLPVTFRTGIAAKETCRYAGTTQFPLGEDARGCTSTKTLCGLLVGMREAAALSTFEPLLILDLPKHALVSAFAIFDALRVGQASTEVPCSLVRQGALVDRRLLATLNASEDPDAVHPFGLEDRGSILRRRGRGTEQDDQGKNEPHPANCSSNAPLSDTPLRVALAHAVGKPAARRS